MLDNENKEQKSPKRRFLLILGVAAFIGFLTLGLMIIFWDDLPLQVPYNQRVLFGSVIIIYAVLRFARYLRREPNEV